MAVTENTYTGNGSTVLYSFTFPYLETTDIKVSVNSVLTTAYTLANATTVQFNSAPANGAAIRIFRETDDTALAATFYSGSAIRSQDLNDNFDKALYIAQETKNITIQASTGNLADGSITNNLLANSAVTTAKIADGSVTSDKIASLAVSETKIANGAVTPAKLAETYLTTAAASSTYQTQAGMSAYLTTANAATTYAPISSFTTTSANKTLANRERCSVLASGLTITLPSSPSAGWEVSITVVGSISDTVVARNGQNIMSLAEDMTIDKGDLTVTLLFVDATRGWRII